MEERGIRLDVALLGRIGADMERELEKLVYDIQGHAEETLNVNSTKMLGEVLFEKLRIQDAAGVKRPKRTKTGWATDAETLSTLYGTVPIVIKLLEYREIAKLKSTYVDALPRFVHPETGRVHGSFSQVSAATGRLASSDPNLQNIPVRTERGRELRKAFVPREPDERGTWCLLAADYSQIELRVMAHLSGDGNLIRAFQEGQDIHAATAARIFDVMPELVTREMRSQAKVINFGLLYGMGPQRVARETGLSLPESKEFIDRYFGAFPKVRVWIDALLASARETGYVETLLGRRRRTPDILSKNSRARSSAENAAVNTPVQGSAADVIKRAMIDLERELAAAPLAGQLLLQVHDELVLEVPLAELAETTALVKRCMEDAVALDVPLAVDVGHGANWLEAH
jgi:DNA polymerase-1